MFKSLFIVILCLIQPSNTFADILFSIEHPTSPEQLKAIYETIVAAQERDEEMQQMPTFYRVMYQGAKLPYLLQCKPKLPDVNGKGCKLSSSPTKQAAKGELSVSISKDIEKHVVQMVLASVQKKIQDTDPNTTTAHLNFPNPFNTNAQDVISYYCESVGIAPNKKWECFLSVQERK